MRHLALQLFDFLALKFDDIAVVDVDEVIVVGFGHFLVARAVCSFGQGPTITEIVALENAGLLEQANGAVYRRQANVGVQLGRAPVNFLGVLRQPGWSLESDEDTRDPEPPLLGHLHALRHACVFDS